MYVYSINMSASYMLDLGDIKVDVEIRSLFLVVENNSLIWSNHPEEPFACML